jgi:hypothetical protein
VTDRVRSVTVIAVALATACVDTPPLAEPLVESSHIEIKQLYESPGTRVDVLIYVDESIAPYRNRLAAEAQLASVIGKLRRNWADMRVAVTGSDGVLRRVPGSGEPFLVDVVDFGYRWKRNYSGALAETLRAMFDAGVAGGSHQPLEALRIALESNPSFLRDQSELAIVIATGVDDASPWPIDEYARWLASLRGGSWGRRVVVGGVVPSVAPRLAEYFRMLSSSLFATTTAIDGDDLAHPFDVLLHTQWSLLPLICMEKTPLRGPATSVDEGPYQCSLSVLVDGQLRTAPPCKSSRAIEPTVEAADTLPSPACWALEPYPHCSYLDDTGLSFELRGYTLDHSPELRFECVVP